MVMLAKKTTTWQKKVQKLAHNHAGKTISTQEQEEKFIPFQQKFITLKKVVDNKKSEMHATEDLCMCQFIIDEIILSLYKFIIDLKVLETELEWQ